MRRARLRPGAARRPLASAAAGRDRSRFAAVSTFFVPVRTSKAGTLSLQTGRLPSGERVGLAFTSEATLLLAFGPAQQFVHLAAPALIGLLAPLGINHFRIDPWRADAATPRTREPARIPQPAPQREPARLRPAAVGQAVGAGPAVGFAAGIHAVTRQVA